MSSDVDKDDNQNLPKKTYNGPKRPQTLAMQPRNRSYLRSRHGLPHQDRKSKSDAHESGLGSSESDIFYDAEEDYSTGHYKKNSVDGKHNHSNQKYANYNHRTNQPPKVCDIFRRSPGFKTFGPFLKPAAKCDSSPTERSRNPSILYSMSQMRNHRGPTTPMTPLSESKCGLSYRICHKILKN